MLFVWETKRRDRLETFAHHVATIVLIAYSYYLKRVIDVGFVRVCVCVGEWRVESVACFVAAPHTQLPLARSRAACPRSRARTPSAHPTPQPPHPPRSLCPCAA